MSRSVRNLILILVVCFFLPLAIFIAYTEWDIHRLKSFCNDVRPRMSIPDLRAIGSSHGIDQKWLQIESSHDDQKRRQFFVPALSQMGDMVCAIEHDGTAVLSKELNGP